VCCLGYFFQGFSGFSMHSGFYGHTRQFKGQRDRVTLQAMPSTSAVEQDSPSYGEEFRLLTLSLLQRVGNADELMREGSSELGLIDFHSFLLLLKKVDIDCKEEDAHKLFQMIDVDESGAIDWQEMRQNIRNSGAIREMYADSLSSFANVLVATLAIGAAIGVAKGLPSALDFATGFLVEDSLSVDNLFVFLVLFRYFRIPPSLQTYCLNVGIYGAVVLRALCIFAGLVALKAFQPLLLVFAAFLIYSSYQSLIPSGDEDDDESEAPPEVVQQLLQSVPTTDEFDGENLFTKSPSGAWLATPLALCIISVELSDVLFAVDSIPAVFGVTDDPVIVFTSNICAILGLRSLYQVLSIAAQDFVYLEKSVAIVLGFVGVKLCAEVAGYEVSSALSLAFIVLTLGGGILASKIKEAEGKERGPKKSTVERLFKIFLSIFDSQKK